MDSKPRHASLLPDDADATGSTTGGEITRTLSTREVFNPLSDGPEPEQSPSGGSGGTAMKKPGARRASSLSAKKRVSLIPQANVSYSAKKRSTFLGQFAMSLSGGGDSPRSRNRASTDAQGRPRKTVGRVRMLSHAASNVSTGLGILGGIPKQSMDMIDEDL